MHIDWAALNPPELVVLLVAGGGLAIVALFSRRLSRWFALAYGCLLVGAVATNAETLVAARALNLVEHAVGNMGAGLATAVAAYAYRRHTVVDNDLTDVDAAGADPIGDEPSNQKSVDDGSAGDDSIDDSSVDTGSVDTDSVDSDPARDTEERAR